MVRLGESKNKILIIMMFVMLFSATKFSGAYAQTAEKADLADAPLLAGLMGVERPLGGFDIEIEGIKTAELRPFPPVIDADSLERAAQSMIQKDQMQSVTDGINYEWTEAGEIRFWYRQFPHEKKGYTWFIPSTNLRGRVLRLDYKGVVPKEMTFIVARSLSGAKSVYKLQLQNTMDTKSALLAIPDHKPFENVSRFMLEIERANAGKTFADFTIQKIELLESFHE